MSGNVFGGRRLLHILIVTVLSFGVYAGDVSVSSVSARQRYPWNGLVDVDVTFLGASNDVANCYCSFAATNVTTQAAIPVTHITPRGNNTGADTTWTRHFVWNATTDVGEVKIDSVMFSVTINVGVQLWEGGPYWAECNVGASKPEDFGFYFWWGDTVGYTRKGGNLVDGYYYSAVTWVSSGGQPMSTTPFDGSTAFTYDADDTQLKEMGYIDSTGNLTSLYDAATVHRGPSWRMPTDTDWDSLINNCTVKWITKNEVNGRLVTGKGKYAEKSIFLPGAGSCLWASYSNFNMGYYWSSTPDSGDSTYAWFLHFSSDFFYRDCRGCYDCRDHGQSVRPLRDSFTGATDTGSISAMVWLQLDCRTGTRVSDTTEQITFSPVWETAAEGATSTVRINGDVITNATETGTIVWKPVRNGTYQFEHVVSTNGISIGETLSATFTVEDFVSAPIIEPVSGTTFDTSLTINISCPTDGATIHFTTNGTVPTIDSPVYKRFKIYEKATVKAIAVGTDGSVSEVVTAAFAKGISEMPMIVPADGATFHGTSQEVSITRTGTDGVLRYTIDGYDPTTESPVYAGAFAISGTTTVKAKIFGDQFFDSAVVTSTITRVWGIGDAMNDPDREFMTDDTSGWVRETVVTLDGKESMRSGKLAHSTQYGTYVMSTMSTMVSGKGTVRFWWKASCEDDEEWDHGEFTADGIKWKIHGEAGWREVSHVFETEGEHTVTWTYFKDNFGTEGEDCIWVDMFHWTPLSTETTTVPVPGTWIDRYYPDTFDYEAVAKRMSANGLNTVEEAYMAGTDPTNATSVFSVAIDMSNGVPRVRWSPDLNEGGTKVLREYKVWGRETLDGTSAWEYPTNALHRFFKVTVGMPEE